MNRVTIYHPALYEKPQKLPLFRPSDSFVRVDALNLGSKFEVLLTTSHSEKHLNSTTVSWAFAIPNSKICQRNQTIVTNGADIFFQSTAKKHH